MRKQLKKYYLFLAALVVTCVFVAFYQRTFSIDYESYVEDFKKRFIQQEEALDKALYYKGEELDNSEILPQWKRINSDNSTFLHVYRNDSLIFWNTNKMPIIRFADIHFPSSGVIRLQNGWYYAKIKEVDDYLICASFRIKNAYSYNNDALSDDFSEKLSIPFNANIGLDPDHGYPVFSKDGWFAFSIVPHKYQSADTSESLVLTILLLGCIALWLFWLSRWSGKFKRWSWIVPVILIGLRYASIHWNWFGFMSGTLVYDPSLYGTNMWLPNFFEYLVNIAFIIYLMHEMGSYWKRMKKSRLAKPVSVMLFISTFGLWGFFIYLTKGLVENSSIPLEIDQLFSLNGFSILAIISLGALFFGYFNFVRALTEACEKQEVTAAQLAVISFLASCVFFFYEINYGARLFFAAIFPLVFYEIILYLVYRRRHNNSIGLALILLALFSVVGASCFTELNERKEKGERELYANQLATEKSVVTELEYKELAPRIAKDNFLKRFISSPAHIGISDFNVGMERRLFKGFWERYEVEFHLFNENHEALVDQSDTGTDAYDYYQEVITRSGTPSEIDSNIILINDHTDQLSYIIRQELYGRDSTRAILFCELRSKKIPEEIGFPRLLISNNANVLEPLERYSIGKYYKGKLTTSYGAYHYPSALEVLLPEHIKNGSFFNYQGFNHYYMKDETGDVHVLSLMNYTLTDYITSFSYLFTFYGILLLPLLFRMNRGEGFSRTLSLAMKIQLGLISLVFISLFAFGWGSGIFIRTQYNQFTNDVIREKLSSVETEVRAKLGGFDELSIYSNGDYMQNRLQKFARVFFTDINMYDEQGYLLATSRPRVFNVGLISEQMNPMAFKHMSIDKQSEFVQQENIGNLSFSSAYKPFYNNKGKLTAYINLQHFGQQREFQNQIEQFLVAIINVFILLLAISVILAIFISNWLTAPLRILQENFAKIKFGKHNEQIEYNRNDEIGSLVKDYNQKLQELEFTAQQLARSERELAWREMAKQVAHEIKNPLTPMKLSVQQLLRSYNPDDPGSADRLKKVANSIIEQIDALTKIANEFSSFAKMPNPSESKVELIALIQGVKEVFKGQVAIELQTDVEEIYVMADRDQFVRVFNNLLKNAIQAIPEKEDGLIEISIRTLEHDKIQISIKDNGVGIAREEESKIFVPYFTTKGTGTGLGLAMVKQIIENHKGSIDFETEVNVGTTFYIVLPYVD